MAIRTDIGLSIYDAFSPDNSGTWAGTPLTISETTGLRRTLQLSGRALPYAGASFPVRRRGRTTWYQGTKRATQHVQGVEQGETNFEGQWDSQHLADDPTSALFGVGLALVPVLSAEQLREHVYSLVTDGQELAVTWAGIVRTAGLCDFDPHPLNRTTCRWTWRFEWNGEGAFVPLAVVDTVASTAANVLDMIDEGLRWAKYPGNVALDLMDFAESQVLAVEGLAVELGDTLNLYATAATRTAEVGARGVSICDTIRRIAIGVRDHFAGLYCVSEGATVGVGIDPTAWAAEARLAAWLRETGRSSEQLAAVAGRAASALTAVADPEVEAVITVQGDTDLRHVALQRWGTADGWVEIAEYNDLDTVSGAFGAMVPAGTVLRIPRRRKG